MTGTLREKLEPAISRTVHMHGRVGFEEGPQVPHPAAPEYRYALEKFESWWDRMFAARRANGAEVQTFTPKFGPPGYMQRLPFTRQPLADLFEVNHWIGERTKERLKAQQERHPAAILLYSYRYID
jgi:hypothetical protein